jgi:RNA polymerase sigma-70 factor (ECF subfamily)
VIDRDRMTESALNDLVRDHSAPLLRYVNRLTFNDRQLAEEIVQETFVRAWQRPRVLTNGYKTISPWLFTVARNLVHDQRRRRANRPSEVGDAELAVILAEPDRTDDILLAQAVQWAMARLSQEHRAVLIQVYQNDMSFVDAARRLGIPEGTAKSRIHYALRSLRSVLEELGIRR